VWADLYVWEASASALDAVHAVSEALTIEIELRDSSFYGGDYFRGKQRDDVILLANYMEDDGEPFFKAQPVGTVCLQLSPQPGDRERLAAVPGLRLVS
jgi:hypothetical protein